MSRATELYLQWREKVREHAEWPELPYDDKTRFLVVGLGGEVGEMLNLIKKSWRGDYAERQYEYQRELEQELVDVIGYAFMLAEHLGIDPVIASLNKLIEVEQRPAWKAWQASKIRS
jgi:NTP pyrophosphatase (non-canonical NTP hydrolase)